MVKKEVRIGLTGLEHPAGARIEKKTKFILNNPRSSIKPGSASDPKVNLID